MELVSDGQPHFPPSLLVAIQSASQSPHHPITSYTTHLDSSPSEHAATPILRHPAYVHHYLSMAPIHCLLQASLKYLLLFLLFLFFRRRHIFSSTRVKFRRIGWHFSAAAHIYGIYYLPFSGHRVHHFHWTRFAMSRLHALTFEVALSPIASLIGLIEDEPIERKALEKTARELAYESSSRGNSSSFFGFVESIRALHRSSHRGKSHRAPLSTTPTTTPPPPPLLLRWHGLRRGNY